MGASFKNQIVVRCSLQQMLAIIKDPDFCKKLNLKAVELVQDEVQEEPQEIQQEETQDVQQEKNRIAFHFTHGVTFTSWGENISITLTPDADNGICVEVYSVCVEEQQMIDMGKNKSNTKHILEYIEKAVRKLEETMQAAAYQAAAIQAVYQTAAQNAAMQMVAAQRAVLQAAQPMPPVQPTQPVAPEQYSQPAVPQRRFCIHCGKALVAGSKFCAFCGAPQ